MTIITGREAIEYTAEHGGTLNKYADPIEGALEGLSPDEARDVARIDPSLVWREVEDYSKI